MRLRSSLGDVRRYMWCSLHARRMRWGERGPVVSFSFDDFPRSAFTVGAPILERFGTRATYYVAMGLIDKTNNLGEQFRLDDLYSLVDRGHELGSHTFNHASSRNVPLDTFTRDVEEGERAIWERTNIPPSNNFAYPYGAVTLRAKKAVGSTMRSCRGICGGFNGPDVDLNLLRANSLFGGADQIGAIKKLIMENERRKSWLILYSHDVSTQPSRFGCTPELLEAAVSFAAQRGARILTVEQVVAELE